MRALENTLRCPVYLFLYLNGLCSIAKATPPWIESVELEQDTNQVILHWTGDANTFAVESSFNLSDWETYSYVKENTVLLPARSGAHEFVRIRELDDNITVVAESEERLAKLRSIQLDVMAVPEGSVEEENQAIAEILRQVGDISGVEISNDCVWGEFPDGRLITIMNNREILPLENVPQTIPRPIPAPSEFADEARRAIRANSSPGSLPNSNKVFLLSSMFILPVWQIGASLDKWFSESGYMPRHTNASVFAFRSVQDAGVFYFEGHSAERADVAGGRVLLSDTPVFSSLPKSLSDLVEGYGLHKPRGPLGFFYLVGPKFTENSMSFSSNSVAFLNGCNSVGLSSHFKGNPLVLAWDGKVGDVHAWLAGRYYFDRMLGANGAGADVLGLEVPVASLKVSPPQRSFDHDLVYRTLVASGFHDTNSIKILSAKGDVNARLRVFSNNSDFGLLTPSIERLVIEESVGQIRASGIFDSNASMRILVETSTGTRDLVPNSVTSSLVTFDFPASKDNSSAKVRIAQRGRQSNRIPITEWTIPIRVVNSPAGSAELRAVSEAALHFRADVHSFRTTPEATPHFAGAGAQLSTLSEGMLVSASGTATSRLNDSVTRWSLNEAVAIPSSNLRGVLLIDEAGKVNLFGGTRAANGIRVTITQKDGSEQSFTIEGGSAAQTGGVDSTMDLMNYTIAEGKGQAGGSAGEFSWKTTKAVNPPTGNFAR